MAKLSRIASRIIGTSKEDDSPALRTALIALVAIVIGLAVLAFASCPAWAVALLWAMASMAAGGMLGFLFGVPKVLQDQAQPGSGYRQVVNTNLDQISDWLTKVVVGLTLVNARDLSKSLVGTGEILGKALGGGPSHTAVGVATIVYFAVIGFLATYILTRLYLAQAFYYGDQPPPAEVAALLKRADEEEAAGRQTEAKKLRAQALATAEMASRAPTDTEQPSDRPAEGAPQPPTR
jgi:hypothetical protein